MTVDSTARWVAPFRMQDRLKTAVPVRQDQARRSHLAYRRHVKETPTEVPGEAVPPKAAEAAPPKAAPVAKDGKTGAGPPPAKAPPVAPAKDGKAGAKVKRDETESRRKTK